MIRDRRTRYILYTTNNNNEIPRLNYVASIPSTSH